MGRQTLSSFGLGQNEIVAGKRGVNEGRGEGEMIK